MVSDITRRSVTPSHKHPCMSRRRLFLALRKLWNSLFMLTNLCLACHRVLAAVMGKIHCITATSVTSCLGRISGFMIYSRRGYGFYSLLYK